jgi:predicted DNA-binding transcriptional regulator YafY
MPRPADVGHLLLSFIPRQPSAIDTTRLLARLEDHGIKRTQRAIQALLHDLAEVFPIDCDTKSKPYRWYWLKDAPAYEFPPMNAHTALTLKLAYGMMDDLLPRASSEQLRAQQRRADEVLAKAASAGMWSRKVRVFPRGFNLLPPKVDRRVLGAVYDALFEDRCVHVRYRLRGKTHESEFDVNPIALVARGSLLTLVCTIGATGEIRQLHLHRMKAATPLDRAARRPPGFDLDAHIGEGHLSFRMGTKVKLVARVTEPVAETLSETPMSADQTLSAPSDGWARVEATVVDTLELRAWIASYGPNIEVLEPAVIREEVAANATKTAGLYAGQGGAS